MDKRSQEYFDKLTAKSPESLTDEEVAFLRARRSYLKKSQLEEYDSILNPQVENQTPKGTVKKYGKTNTK